MPPPISHSWSHGASSWMLWATGKHCSKDSHQHHKILVIFRSHHRDGIDINMVRSEVVTMDQPQGMR
eukprot:3430195-Amphidinium_carterae.1